MGKINKYFKSVFSIKTIATVSVIAMILAGVYYLNMTSTTGKMWGVEQSTVLIVIYALAGLTLISVYYFNVKKSGWLLAILTLIIQTISARSFKYARPVQHLIPYTNIPRNNFVWSAVCNVIA